MSEEVCNELALIYNPDIVLNMQSANGKIDKSLDLARNVPFLIGDIALYLQVHVIREPAYNILLGHPFNVLTESIVKNFANKNQTIIIHDLNTECNATVPTLARGPPCFVESNRKIPDRICDLKLFTFSTLLPLPSLISDSYIFLPATLRYFPDLTHLLSTHLSGLHSLRIPPLKFPFNLFYRLFAMIWSPSSLQSASTSLLLKKYAQSWPNFLTSFASFAIYPAIHWQTCLISVQTPHHSLPSVAILPNVTTSSTMSTLVISSGLPNAISCITSCVCNTKALLGMIPSTATFREDFFPPVDMPVITHKPWVLHNMPIPPGIYDKVCDVICTKIAAGVYEPSNSSYCSRWFTIIKKDGSSLRLVHSLEPLNAVTIQHSGIPPYTDQIAEQFAGRTCGGMLDLYVEYDE
ncbi:hypothetical protein EW146_g9237 [Bondarzewia mesenterica]|uniref:Uncharacterized protein n=1 Tax=Bondarzewia mesenterica TaxID=1095465 RepID=A0A4S4L881_9AGAM|nr:hypothetical protein EW146_g9237 [Bondarzewia mesenterica]